MADLQLSGIPIEGEAGVGYTLRRGSDVPPLMFTRAELEALVVGARFTEAFAGERLAAAARHALTKVEAVLPDDLRRRTERSRVLVPAARRAAARASLDAIHQAMEDRRLVRFAYARLDGEASQRDVEPVCLAFWAGGRLARGAGCGWTSGTSASTAWPACAFWTRRTRTIPRTGCAPSSLPSARTRTPKSDAAGYFVVRAVTREPAGNRLTERNDVIIPPRQRHPGTGSTQEVRCRWRR